MKRILIVFPTAWDFRQLDACQARWRDRYELIFEEPKDEDCPWDLDPVEFVDRMARRYQGSIDGVFSSSDYPGATLAGALSVRLGLPGSPGGALLRTAHKYFSRLVQREVAPEATPEFHLVDPADPADSFGKLQFPLFLKPVKGAFSVLATKIESPHELREFLALPQVNHFLEEYLTIYNRAVLALSDLSLDGRYFLAEEYLHGQLVTLEGHVRNGQVQVPWITDSVIHPETGSFLRFDHPSSLPGSVKDRMRSVVVRVVEALGLNEILFNVEMIHDPTRDVDHIIEINPRMCGQFADLYQKVTGIHGHEVALALAAGDELPVAPATGSLPLASSVPLRIFEPSRFVRAPGEEDLRAAEALRPGTLIWSECRTGQEMKEFLTGEDGKSARYGIINLAASDAADRDHLLDAIVARLGFVIVSL